MLGHRPGFLRSPGAQETVSGRGFFWRTAMREGEGQVKYAESELLNFAVLLKPVSEVRHLATLFCLPL